MEAIKIKKNRILYYSNTAGYLDAKRNTAIVDPMFENDELKSYLSNVRGLDIQWTPGTFDRLAAGTSDSDGNLQVLKKCRVYQLKPDSNVMMKFIGYDDFRKRFGEPDPASYQVVYDGEVETNDLEVLYTKFNLEHPPGYRGHSLSMSDVVELYDASGSTFHYVDRFEFREITFQELELEEIQGPQMNM